MFNKIIGSCFTATARKDKSQNGVFSRNIRIDKRFKDRKSLKDLYKIKNRVIGVVGNIELGSNIHFEDKVIIVNLAYDRNGNPVKFCIPNNHRFSSGVWIIADDNNGGCRLFKKPLTKFSTEMFSRIDLEKGDCESEITYEICNKLLVEKASDIKRLSADKTLKQKFKRRRKKQDNNELVFPAIDQDAAVEKIFSTARYIVGGQENALESMDNNKLILPNNPVSKLKEYSDTSEIRNSLVQKENERIAKILKEFIKELEPGEKPWFADISARLDKYKLRHGFFTENSEHFIGEIVRYTHIERYSSQIEKFFKSEVGIVPEILSHYNLLKNHLEEYEVLTISGKPQKIILVNDEVICRTGKFSLQKHAYAMCLAAMLDDKLVFKRLVYALGLFGSFDKNTFVSLRGTYEDFRKSSERDASEYPSDFQLLAFALSWQYQNTGEKKYHELARNLMDFGINKYFKSILKKNPAEKANSVSLTDYVLPALNYLIQERVFAEEKLFVEDGKNRDMTGILNDIYHKGMEFYKDISEKTDSYINKRQLNHEFYIPFSFISGRLNYKTDFYMHNDKKLDDFKPEGLEKLYKKLKSFGLFAANKNAKSKGKLEEINSLLKSEEFTFNALVVILKNKNKELPWELFLEATRVSYLNDPFNKLTPYMRYKRRKVNQEIMDILVPGALKDFSARKKTQVLIDALWNRLWERADYLIDWLNKVENIQKELYLKLSGSKSNYVYFPSEKGVVKVSVKNKKEELKKLSSSFIKVRAFIEDNRKAIELDEGKVWQAKIAELLPKEYRYRFDKLYPMLFIQEGLDRYFPTIPLFMLALDMLWFRQKISFDRKLFSQEDINILIKNDMCHYYFQEHSLRGLCVKRMNGISRAALFAEFPDSVNLNIEPLFIDTKAEWLVPKVKPEEFISLIKENIKDDHARNRLIDIWLESQRVYEVSRENDKHNRSKRFTSIAELGGKEFTGHELNTIRTILNKFEQYKWSAFANKGIEGKDKLFLKKMRELSKEMGVSGKNDGRVQYIHKTVNSQDWTDIANFFKKYEDLDKDKEGLSGVLINELLYQTMRYGYNFPFTFIAMLTLVKDVHPLLTEKLARVFRDGLDRSNLNPSKYVPTMFKGKIHKPIEEMDNVFDIKFYSILSLLVYIGHLQGES